MTTVPLSELVRLRRGATYKSALLGSTGVPLLGLGTIERHGGFRANKVKFYAGDAPDRMVVRSGDLYVSLKDMTHEAALLGAIARVPAQLGPARLTQDTIALDVTAVDRVDRAYLYWQLRTPMYRAYCRAHGTGTTNLDLSREDFLAFRIPLPAVDEQRRQVAVLGALDEKIAAELEVQRSARSLAVGVVSEQTDSCLVGDLASISGGTVSPARMSAIGVTHFSLPSFDQGFAAFEDPRQIKSAKHLLTGPVVLVSKLNPRIPRIWPLDLLPPGQSVASTEFVPLKPRGTLAVGELWAALSAPAFSSGLLAHVAGTTGSHQRVKPADLLSVPIADIRVLSDGARALVRKLCRLANDRTRETRRLTATRDELLPLLMSGRITVKDAERRVEEET